MALTERPALLTLADAEQVLAMAHVGGQPHVVVIGRRTLPAVLALLQRGCAGVRSLRPDLIAPDCEPADLAWILDVQSMHEFDDALQAANRRCRLIVVEAAAYDFCRQLLVTAAQCGLDVITFDHVAGRITLAPRLALARAA